MDTGRTSIGISKCTVNSRIVSRVGSLTCWQRSGGVGWLGGGDGDWCRRCCPQRSMVGVQCLKPRHVGRQARALMLAHVTVQRPTGIVICTQPRLCSGSYTGSVRTADSSAMTLHFILTPAIERGFLLTIKSLNKPDTEILNYFARLVNNFNFLYSG